MKFSAVLCLGLLLCVIVFSITAAAGHYNYRHSLHKRQDNVRCQSVGNGAGCRAGSSAQDTINFLLQCNQTNGARAVQEGCNQFSVQTSLPAIQPMETCTETSIIQRVLSEVNCQRSFVEAVQSELSRQDCQNTVVFNVTTEACLANAEGVYCSAISDAAFSAQQQASVACTDTSTCDVGCVEALNNLNNNVGCCINHLLNDTQPSPDYLSFQFWSRCGVVPPGLCELRINHASGVGGSIVVIVLAVLSLLCQ